MSAADHSKPTTSPQDPLQGPVSRSWLRRLKAVESPNVTFVSDDFPVVWDRALGSRVWDVDGREYLDAGGAFGVGLIGHNHPDVAAAVTQQAQTLMHGMGDVHPPAVRIALLERLTAMAPGDLGHAVLCTGGAEAVEVALKTAVLATGKAGSLAFSGGYHGLTTGALAVTARPAFRQPFAPHLPQNAYFSAFPRADGELSARLADVERLLAQASHDIGVVMVEPIQGRAGTVIPPDGWLAGLAKLCRRYGALLACDEIFTGFGRTGTLFACQREGVVPDLLCVGKALGGGMPISACLGRPDVMAAWGESTGEALHTSTFLGHPVASAAALAALAVIEREDIPTLAASKGQWLVQALEHGLANNPLVAQVRGRGLMVGIEVAAGDRASPADVTIPAMLACLRRRLLVLPAGDGGEVLQLTPSALMTREDLADVVERVVASLDEVAA